MSSILHKKAAKRIKHFFNGADVAAPQLPHIKNNIVKKTTKPYWHTKPNIAKKMPKQ